MATRFLTGRMWNALERSTVTVTSEDADYQKASLYDYRSLRPFKFAAPATTVTITVDLKLLQNGNMEAGSGSTFTGWTATTTGTGSVGEETVTVEQGARSMRVKGGTSGQAQYAQAFTARSGERLSISGWARGDGSHLARVQVFNTMTSRYLHADGTWGAGADLFTVASATGPGTNGYSLFAFSAFVEPFSVTLSDLVSIEVRLYSAENGFAYFDDITIFPSINFASIHGHNLASVVGTTGAPVISMSDGTTTYTFTTQRPSFYLSFAAVDKRVWTFSFAGGLVPAVGLGEVVLGYTQTLGRSPAAPRISPHQTDADRAQVRAETGAGDAYIFQRSSFERRTVHLPYLTNDAVMREIVREIHQRSENGLYPLIVVPNDAKPDVILGRLEPSRSSRHIMRAGTLDAQNQHQQDLVIRELAFPQFAV